MRRAERIASRLEPIIPQARRARSPRYALHRTTHSITLTLIAIGALAGLYAAALRFRVEAHNRGVEIAIDYNEAATLSAATRMPLDELLRRFRALHVLSIAITEDTPASLEDAGLIQTDGAHGLVAVSSPALLDRIAQGLTDRGLVVAPGARRGEPQATVFQDASGRAITVAGRYASLRNYGIGLDPAAVAQAKRSGMRPVARIGNYPGASADNMIRALARIRDLGAKTVIFTGTEVLGYRGAQREAAGAFEQTGLVYGQIEFGKQKGDEKLAAALDSRFVRVHSISEAEMGLLDQNEAIDRFVRAARERNIRLCYVRMVSFAGADAVETNLKYMRSILGGIARRGEMGFRYAKLYTDPGVPVWAFALVGLGVGAGAALLLRRLLPLSSASDATFSLLLPVAVGAIAALGGDTGRKVGALLAALVYPTLACIRREGLDDPPDSPPLAPTAALGRAFGAIVRASGVTALGILSVIGLLASLPFIVKVEQFAGIKAAHAAPILLIGALAVSGIPAAEGWRAARERTAAFLAEPVRVGMLMLAIIAAVGLGLIIARTGNEPGVGVSGAELRARAVLDRVLPIRPRTKEFLVGHPCFVLAAALWWRGRRRWTRALFVVGTVGQVSILNTFCHIHTPLYLSFVRDVTGLVLGGLLGGLAFLLIEWAMARTETRRGSAACV